MKHLLFALLMLMPLTLFARRGRYNNDNCIVEMQTRRGRSILEFKARNCRQAKRQCRRMLRRRQDRGRNPYASCKVVDGGYWDDNRGGDYDYDYSTWTCKAQDEGWEEHRRGHYGTGQTRRKARRRAMRECLRHHGECYVTDCSQR
ncbi:MAG: hypothetical protein ISR65_11080 [Bacteriovoracaceae bacterium]|nr:hypothetical protein [Bacteriovoracaceae bacterium]